MPENIEHLLYAQLLFEMLLILLLIIVLWRGKAKKNNTKEIPHEFENHMEKFLIEAQKISKEFEKNLKQKKELSSNLILKLDRKLADYKKILHQANLSFQEAEKKINLLQDSYITQEIESLARANPAAPETRSLVLQLAKKGLSIDQIALKTKLHKGEVELIIDLDKQFSF